jgi:hypothetical protein
MGASNGLVPDDQDQTYAGSILPFTRDASGVHFDPHAGLLGQIINAFTLPGDVYSGKAPVSDASGNPTPGVMDRATSLASFLSPGAVTAEADNPVVLQPTRAAIRGISPSDVNQNYRMIIGGRNQGVLSLNNEYPHDLYVNYVGNEDGPSSLGARNVRALLGQVAARYPDAQTISGYRGTGARSGLSSADMARSSSSFLPDSPPPLATLPSHMTLGDIGPQASLVAMTSRSDNEANGYANGGATVSAEPFWANDPIVNSPASAGLPGQSSSAAPAFTSNPGAFWENDPIVDSSGNDNDASNAAAPSIVNGLGRSFASGVPIIGGLLDKADAATNAALAPVLNPIFSPEDRLSGDTFGERYANALAQQQGMDQAFTQQHPVLDTGAKVAGAVASSIPAMRAAPELFGLGEQSLLARTGASAATGSVLGGVDAAVRNNGDPNAIKTGAELGFGTGALAPAIGSVAGNIAGTVAQKISGLRGAPALLSRALSDDAIAPEDVIPRLQQIGDSGMVADLGPNLQRQAGALAALPGDAQQVVRSTVGQRAANAGQRITDATSEALGQPVDMLQQAQQLIASRAKAAAPLYDAAYAQTMPLDEDIGRILQKPAAQKAWSVAAELAENEGNPIDRAAPSVRALDLVKRALDDQISVAQRAGNLNQARTINLVRTNLLDAVDSAVPEYAAARAAYAGPSAILDAMDAGANIFSSKTTPNALRQQLAGYGDDEQEAFMQGARSAVADVMGTARNDASAARSLFAKGYNQEKLEQLVGVPQAQKLLNQIQSEDKFTQTSNVVSGNSETAARQAATEELKPQPGQLSSALESLFNIRAGTAARQVIGAVHGAAANAAVAARNRQLAGYLMENANGAKLPAVLTAIQRAQRRGDITSATMGQLVNALIRTRGQKPLELTVDKYSPQALP